MMMVKAEKGIEMDMAEAGGGQVVLRRGWLLVGNSLMVILLSWVLTFFLGGTLLYWWNPFAMMGFFVILPGVVALAYGQFNAVFRYKGESACWVYVMYFVSAGLAILLLISTLVEIIQDKPFNREVFLDFVIQFGGRCIGVAVYSVFCGILMMRWYRKIRRAGAEGVVLSGLLGRRIITEIFFAVFLVPLVLGGVYGHYRGEIIDFGEGVESVDWLPEPAGKVSYYISYNYTAYEFTIPEEDFLEWVKGKGWEVAEITSPVAVERYNQRKDRVKGQSEVVQDEPDTANVEAGLYYKELERDGGRTVVVYDRAKERAHYQGNPR